MSAESDKMFWGKHGGCAHCSDELNSFTATYTYKSGYGVQQCDFCWDKCNSFEPCQKWSDDKKKFFNDNGYIDPSRFDKSGKLNPPSGFAVR